MKKLRILELTNYSAGICGVWQRVKQESMELSKKGYSVRVFSSNAVKGSNEIAEPEDKIGKIQIQRFPFKKLGGESFMSWDFEKEALDYSPDIIIAHSYRHPHTLKALRIKEKLNQEGKTCKVFLVTHAPFVKLNITRSKISSLAVFIYDLFIGRRILNRFDRIIAITKWEIPYLLRLGCRKEKIIIIPNGIPKEFFNQKKFKEENKILFLGRISPIKSIETLIKAMKGVTLPLSIVGPSEEGYKNELEELIKKLDLKNITFFQAVYDMLEKIRLIDNHEIFVLPSKREAMPQSLIEAMARGKLVISSDNPGSKEIISNNENGFIFQVGNSKELEEIINKIQKMSYSQKERIKFNAKKFVKRFRWDNLIRVLLERVS